jgi:hypothetical protein
VVLLAALAAVAVVLVITLIVVVQGTLHQHLLVRVITEVIISLKAA